MGIQISCDFPGGNIVVRGIRGNQVLLRRDSWSSSWNWYYFYFEAESTGDARYEFRFTCGWSLSTGGVAYSLDEGVTWDHIRYGAGCARDHFFYDMKAGQKVRFCLGQQYLQKDLEVFLASHPAVRKSVLCMSRKKREVELLRIGEDAPGKIPVLLTSRHHACEMHGTRVLEAVMEKALEIPGFLDKYTVYAVPFVDKDGVEEGNQGKNSIPHDHNRDYGENAIYPEIRALMKLDAEKKFQIVLDFHCPGLGREKIFFFGSEFPHIEQNIEELCDMIGLYGPQWLNFHAGYNVEKFGHGWNQIYADGIPCSRYFASRPWMKLALSNEISYDFANKTLLTTEKLRDYGHGIAKALMYLKLK